MLKLCIALVLHHYHNTPGKTQTYKTMFIFSVSMVCYEVTLRFDTGVQSQLCLNKCEGLAGGGGF